jgi:ketosteroid isomerase-like protein
MRKCTICLLAVVFLFSTLLVSVWAQDTQEQLKKLETERAEAVVKGDVATLEKYTSDDYMLINMNGRSAGKSEMVEGFKSGQSKITSEDLSDLKVRVYGNTAVITGKADIRELSEGRTQRDKFCSREFM